MEGVIIMSISIIWDIALGGSLFKITLRFYQLRHHNFIFIANFGAIWWNLLTLVQFSAPNIEIANAHNVILIPTFGIAGHKEGELIHIVCFARITIR